MCGIAGAVAPVAKGGGGLVARMLRAEQHRGPDDQGMSRVAMGDREVWLGSQRLAILDLTPAGHMPMQDPETGNWIVYNGEVYNFARLRREMEEMGVCFRSRTDTEVVLKAYGLWGHSCVERLRGMFAFAIWDAHNGELFLARDRLGEKPLYYFAGDGVFLFASEVRALLLSGYPSRVLDSDALRIYLHNAFVVDPLTLVRGIRSLMPGHWMRVSQYGAIVEIKRYWSVPTFVPGFYKSVDESIEHTRAALREAVRLRLVSDVPLGAFLSGGLDSSTVVALMAQASGAVRTFTVGFVEKAFDESNFADHVAKRFGTQHTVLVVGSKEFGDWLEDGLTAMDQPTFDGLNTYFVSRAARASGLTVALSGLGGDELFGGYPFFRTVPLLAKLVRASPRATALGSYLRTQGLRSTSGPRKALCLLADPPQRGLELLAAYQCAQALFPPWAQQRLLIGGSRGTGEAWYGLPREFVTLLVQEGRSGDDLGQVSHYALRLFLGQRTLRDTDSMSMAVSLEVRAPFTDHVLVETVWRVAGAVRCKGAPHKPYELELARPYLGQGYPKRRKQGFVFPIQDWLQQDRHLRDMVWATLTNGSLLRSVGLDPIAVQELLGLWSARSIPWSRVWSLFVLVRWLDHHRVYL